MCHEATGAFVEHREISIKTSGRVVGIQQGKLGRALESVWSHHANVHPSDDENGGAAVGGGGHRPQGFGLRGEVRGFYDYVTG